MVNIISRKCIESECDHKGNVKDPSDPQKIYCISCAGKHGLVATSQSGNSIEASKCLDALEDQIFGSRIPYRDRLLPDGSWKNREKYGLLRDHPRLHPDGYIPPPDASPSDFKGTIVEYHGDYYHGYPPWHDAHETHVFRGAWGPDLYATTMERMHLFKDAGFRVLYIWGSGWKRVLAKAMPLKHALREL